MSLFEVPQAFGNRWERRFLCKRAELSLGARAGFDQAYFVPNGNGWSSSFCSTCGSPVPLIDRERTKYFVPAGLLDDDPGHRGYAAHIFVGSKAPWVTLTDKAPKFEAGFDSARVDQV